MNPTPHILCIETSSRIGSVALARGEECLNARTFRTDFNHAIELLPTIQAMCEEQGWRPDAIHQLYLSIGPGSFTGLRIAVSLARTLAWSAGVSIVAVPTLSVIAHNATTMDQPPHHVAVVLDAKRRQVYCAAFALRDGGYSAVLQPAVRDPDELLSAMPAGAHLAGEGIPYHANAWPEDVLRIPEDLWRPRAEWVHRLGWAQARTGGLADPKQLAPLYLRIPEAEEVWRRRAAQASADG